MQPNNSELTYESKDKVLFMIRGQATRRDKSDLNILNSETIIDEGRMIRINIMKSMPWLIERFVTGWSGGLEKTGTEILSRIYEQPSDPEEDLVMVLGSFILNHVKGLTVTQEDISKKKG